MFWLCICKGTYTILAPEEEDDSLNESDHFFFSAYNMIDMDIYRSSLIGFYYALTSLSTVGLGDYVPKSDLERVLCAFMLLFGVGIFSISMNKLLEIVNDVEIFYCEVE